MSWKVSSGEQVGLGVNAGMDYGMDIFHLEDLVLHLQEHGRCNLQTFENPMNTTVWRQGWLQTQDLGLEVDWA